MAIIDLLMGEPANYRTYPAEIERRTHKRVTRAGARSVCDRLVERGILTTVVERSPTWSKATPHYRLREDKQSFIKLVREYFKTLAKSTPFSWQQSAQLAMDSQYMRSRITSKLVRDILSTRNVEIRLVAELEREEKDIVEGDKILLYPEYFPLSLPVTPVGVELAEMVSKVSEVEINDNIPTKKRAFLQQFIKDHYQNEELDIIIPIVALISISPTALEFFLSDWKPNATNSFYEDSQGFEMIEHVLFRLVWGAISDLSLSRTLPQAGYVVHAFVSGGPFTEKAPLLSLGCRDVSLEYYAGFDTVTKPEHCHVRIASWKPEELLMEEDE